MIQRPPRSTRLYTLVPYTTRFRSNRTIRPTTLSSRLTNSELPVIEPPCRVWPSAGAHTSVFFAPLGSAFPSSRSTAISESAGKLWPLRSEEHTSELQSLMRSSYAVFCLTQKHHTNNLDTPTI